MAATVLVVDDSRAVRDAVRIVLEGEGYAVTTAANGAEALERIAEPERPDVVLLDLQMPVMDGWELQRRLRAMGARIPVIVMSALAEVRQEAALLQAEGVLPKPFGMEELIETIERCVGR